MLKGTENGWPAGPRTRRLEVLLSPADEAALSVYLVQTYPHLTFVDDNVWDSPAPRVRSAIPACESGFVFLWNQSLAPTLPTRLRPDGRFDGPIVGPVVQLIRSRVRDNVLESGSIAASPQSAEMAHFVADLWMLLRRWGITKVRSINPRSAETINAKVPCFLIGPDAAVSWSSSRGRLLKARSTENYFAPGTR
jgi:hypothetical protein